jgi:glycosyltransferase involved in cell wall biosynthesis
MTTIKSPPIRVLHIITSLSVGGAETMLLKLVQQMDTSSFQTLVICLSSYGFIGKQIRNSGVNVVYLHMPRGKLTIIGLKRFVKTIKNFRPHLIQTWLYHSDLIGLIVGRVMGVHAILWNLRCSFIDLERYRISTRIVLHICKILSSLPNAIVCNSYEAIRYHKKLGYRNRSWHLIPNGVDPNRFLPDPKARHSLLKELGLTSRVSEGGGETQKHILIGCVARFDPMKDYPSLIEAALQVLKKRRDVIFVLVGRNVEWQHPFFKNAIPAGFLPNFRLLGERRDIARIMASLDIFLLTSYGEGFPNVLCEAMASGVPCIATDVGDCKNIIADTGIVVEPKKPQQICEAILQIIKMSPQNKKDLGVKARDRIVTNYTIDKISDMYQKVYSNTFMSKLEDPP